MMPQVFRAKTRALAQKAAEAALGPDAAVLTTREVPRSGFLGLFGGHDVELAAMPPTRTVPMDQAALRAATPFAPAARASATAAVRDEIAALRADIRADLRMMQALVSRANANAPVLENELAAVHAMIQLIAEGEPPRTAAAGRWVRNIGLEGRAAQTILQALQGTHAGGQELVDEIRDALADMLTVAPWPITGPERAWLAVIGPSGVGKTTTIAKLAARAISEHDKTVTLVACDAVRVGGAEQLRRYADLLDVPFEIASSESDLISVVAEAKTDLVLIDTAGRPPNADGSVELALASPKGRRRLLGPDRARHVLLCMPAGLRASDADAFGRAFGPCGPTELVITKLDETKTPAGIAHAAAATNLPISALCFGQRVPEDIGPATAGVLLDHLAPISTAERRRQRASRDVHPGSGSRA